MRRYLIIALAILVALIVFLITCFIPTTTSSLENNQFEERFKKLSNELRCPTCQGLSVKDSDAGFSTSIKGKIRELMEKGNSDEEIMKYFKYLILFPDLLPQKTQTV